MMRTYRPKRREEKSSTSIFHGQDNIQNSSLDKSDSLGNKSPLSSPVQLKSSNSGFNFAPIRLHAPQHNSPIQTKRGNSTNQRTQSQIQTDTDKSIESREMGGENRPLRIGGQGGVMQKRMEENIQRQHHLESKTNHSSPKTNILQRTNTPQAFQNRSSSAQNMVQRSKMMRNRNNHIQRQNQPNLMNQRSNFFRKTGTIQTASIIQREVEPLAFSKDIKSKKVKKVNKLVTQYNQIESDSDDINVLNSAVMKLREIINTVNQWIQSMKGKQEKIEKVVDVDNKKKKTSGIGFSNWFRLKNKLNKHSSKSTKIAALESWLVGVEKELETRNQKFSQLYGNQMNSKDPKSQFLGPSQNDINQSSTDFRFIKTLNRNNSKYDQLTRTQATAIRTYTTALHPFMNGILQLPPWMAKSRIKSRLAPYVSLKAKQMRLEKLRILITNQQYQLQGYTMDNDTDLNKDYETEVSKLLTEITGHKNAIPNELADQEDDAFGIIAYFGKELGEMADINKTPTNSEFNCQLDRIITQVKTDEFVNQFYNEMSVHNTMAVEGLHSLPPYSGKVYRGDWKASTNYHYSGKKMTFNYFGSASKDKETAMGFVNYYRSKSKNTSDPDRGSYAAFYKKPMLLEITLTGKGGKDISALSSAKTEEEVLLMPGTEVKITKVESVKFADGTDEYILVKATEIGGSEVVEETDTNEESQGSQSQQQQNGTHTNNSPLSLDNVNLDLSSHHGSMSVSSVSSQHMMDDLYSELDDKEKIKFTGLKLTDDKPINQLGKQLSTDSLVDLGNYGGYDEDNRESRGYSVDSNFSDMDDEVGTPKFNGFKFDDMENDTKPKFTGLKFDDMENDNGDREYSVDSDIGDFGYGYDDQKRSNSIVSDFDDMSLSDKDRKFDVV